MDQRVRDLIENEVEVGISVKVGFIRFINGKPYILLAKHKKHNMLMLPGGRAEKKDLGAVFMLEEVLNRELQEELGIRIWDIFNPWEELSGMAIPRGKFIYHQWESKGQPRLDLCLGLVISEEFAPRLNIENIPSDSEIETFEWVSPRTRKKNIFPNTKVMLGYLDKVIAAET